MKFLLAHLFAAFWIIQLFNCISCDPVPCAARKVGTSVVCVCNSTYCDNLEFDLPQKKGDIVIVSTSQAGLRFRTTTGTYADTGQTATVHHVRDKQKRRKRRPQNNSNFNWLSLFSTQTEGTNKTTITVDRSKTFQKIIGFGGAFTGTVSYLFDMLSPELQDNLYRSYYSMDKGNAFNMMRMSIGGCDFDLEPWAYNELPKHDKVLSNFTRLDDRDLRKIQQINRLKASAGNENIKLVGAAWSAPRWMKTNNEWTGFSALRTEYYQTWADYHLKFLDLMAQQNMTFWAISTGNEPMNGVIGFLFVHFMSMGWTGGTQGKWVGENLGPTIRKSAFKDVKLLAGDDQRYTFPWWFSQMNLGHPNATNFVDGYAVHWYWDKYVSPALLDETYKLYPEKIYLNTESCLGDKPFEVHGPVLGSWERGESYINGILQDLQHWVNGWIDWNLILDEKGGPNYVNNFVETAVVVNTTSDEAYKQPIFYILGHFSRFLPPDSVRIDVRSSSKSVNIVGFKRPDGIIALILYNSLSNAIDVNISDGASGNIYVKVPPKSLHSILYI